MTKLSVNINKIATLRNSRDRDFPSLAKVANDIMSFGAHGLTVHPRPDERHIKKSDIPELSQIIDNFNSQNTESVEYNIEGFPSSDFIEMVLDVKPDQCTLVPDPPEALTSNAGWDFVKNIGLLSEVCPMLKHQNIRTSLFLEPEKFNSDPTQLNALTEIKPDRIELYTEKYAEDYQGFNRRITAQLYKTTVQLLLKSKIGVNAGHDLDQENLGYLLSVIPELKEVSIGHALICESLYEGLETTVNNYLKIIKDA